MRYKLLGNSGLRVSELCLGTMTFGEEWGWGANLDESRAMFDAFLEAGGNFVDTANIYTAGTSERFLGEFMQGQRERIVLATKYTNGPAEGDPNAGGNQRKSMRQAVEASLKRLNTDYIDLYWMHIWDKMTPVEEVMRGFDDLVRQGKILYAGISDAPAWWVAQANTLASLRGWTPFVGLQIEYSLLERTPEHELLPMAKALNITVTPWSPLAGGTLAGKYLNADSAEAQEGRHSTPMGGSFARKGERVDNVVKTVVAIAQELGATPSQVSLAWLRYRDQPMIPIIGARKMSQLQDNLASLSVSLTAEHLRRLDEASRPEPIFPNTFFDKEFVGAYVYGGVRDRIDA